MSSDVDLAGGLEALGLDLDAPVRQKLLDFVALVGKWNRVYNLTAVRDAGKMITHHLLDSLAVVPHVRAGVIADVGSGAGLPGIPLAIALPDARVSLIESNQKKATFLRQATIDLGLKNVEVIAARVEAVEPAGTHELVISRAFSDLGEFVTLAGRLCSASGVLAAMKGVYPYEELAQLPSEFRLRSVVPLKVPGLEAERHLVIIERA